MKKRAKIFSENKGLDMADKKADDRERWGRFKDNAKYLQKKDIERKNELDK